MCYFSFGEVSSGWTVPDFLFSVYDYIQVVTGRLHIDEHVLSSPPLQPGVSQKIWKQNTDFRYF